MNDSSDGTSRRTVLLLTPSVRLLGARRSLMLLATRLDRERWRPIVMAKEEGEMTRRLRDAGVEARILPFRPWRKFKFFFFRPFTIARLRATARREDAALIHCNEIYPTPYALRAAAPLGLPVVTHMRLSVTPRLIRNYELGLVDRVVVVSDAAGRDFDHWPDKADRVTTIYNGLDLDEFQPDEEARALWRGRMGIRPDEILFGMMSLISQRKQQHLSIEALARLRRKGLPARLAIIGEVSPREGEYQAQLLELVRELRLRDIVHFEPFLQDPAPAFNAFDVNLLISNDEGFGRVIIEAGALGIPSIGTRVGGIPELIDHERDGLLVADDDAPGLAAAMERLMDDSTRAAYGAAMRAKTIERFSIDAHARRVEALYDEVIRARRTAP